MYCINIAHYRNREQNLKEIEKKNRIESESKRKKYIKHQKKRDNCITNSIKQKIYNHAEKVNKRGMKLLIFFAQNRLFSLY